MSKIDSGLGLVAVIGATVAAVVFVIAPVLEWSIRIEERRKRREERDRGV